MGSFAERTSVSVEKSRLEIERLCTRYGCTKYASAVDYEKNLARIQFHANHRIVRFELKLPASAEFRQASKLEQAARSKWRALVLVLKAKLEAIASGISTFEEEFLPFVVMPNDQTVGEILSPMIDDAYRSGKMPRQLLATNPHPNP